MAEQVVVGIDVSKAKLDIAILPSDEQFTVSNDRDGISHLVQRLKRLQMVQPRRKRSESLSRLTRPAYTGTDEPRTVAPEHGDVLFDVRRMLRNNRNSVLRSSG